MSITKVVIHKLDKVECIEDDKVVFTGTVQEAYDFIKKQVLRRIVLEDLDSALGEGHKELKTMSDKEIAGDMIAYDDALTKYEPSTEELIPFIQEWKKLKGIVV